VSFIMPSDLRYSANFLEVYLPPPSVRNHFTCFPDSFSLRAFHSLDFSMASNLYFNMYSSICCVASLMKSSIYPLPPMAGSSGPYLSECSSCKGSVAWEVVGVKSFRPNLHFMQLSQSHFPVIFGVLATTFCKIPKAYRPTCAQQLCHNIRFSTLCREACPVV